MNLNSKHIYDYYGYRVGDHTRCRNGKCCNLISVGCIQWDFPSTELYNKKETLEEILRKIEELLLEDNSNFPIKNIGSGYELYAGIEDEANAFKTFTSSDGVVITTTPTTINIGFDTSTLPQTGVTSVGLQAPLGFTVINSPVTSVGDLVFDWDSGYTPYTTAEQNKLAGIEAGAQVNVQSDWNATSGAAQILNKPTLATVATTGDYNDLINLPILSTGTVTSVALTTPTGLQVTGSPITSSGTLALAFQTGYSIPTNTSQSNWDTAFGWGDHSTAGYLTTETDPTVPNHVKAITSTQVSNWDTAYSQRIQSLTTTGSSGAATLNSNTLNIPNYTLSGLGGVPSTRSLTINGVTQDLSTNRTWNIVANGLEWENPTDKALGYYNALLNKIDNSNLSQHNGGVTNSGVYIAKTKKGNISGDVQLEDAENFIYTMTGNVNFKFDNLSLADDESAVFTIQLTGNFAFSFPVGVVAQPYVDTYDGGKTNYLTVVITETVAGAIKGYYSLITA